MRSSIGPSLMVAASAGSLSTGSQLTSQSIYEMGASMEGVAIFAVNGLDDETVVTVVDDPAVNSDGAVDGTLIEDFCPVVNRSNKET
ncbi:hypothetical protein NDU88_003233 [Pleurodeles waltl]|uniref:Uncharacterized protein n=1 Tax=Pleurodeles waltl TaxID=8319 RepID=A0AAV7MTN9_PLEWA|nr:hypothetical protein NDU88_003233 [Pleurodeles waltl]